MNRLCSLFLVLSSVAGAAPAVLAVHPLVVSDGEPAEARELAAHFEALLAKLPGPKADAGRVAQFLEGQPGKHCTADGAECFAGLAQASGANRTLFVSVRLYPVVVSGRLVGADGRALVEAPLKQIDKSKGNLVEAAKLAMDELVGSLPLDDSSDVVPLVKDTTRPDEAPKPPVPAIPEAVGGVDGTWRTAGLVVGAAGVAALAGGVAFQLSAGDAARRFDAAAAGSHTMEQMQALRQMQGQSAGQQVAGSVLLGTGAVALAIGGYWLLAKPDVAAKPSKASASLMVGVGGVSIEGWFP